MTVPAPAKVAIVVVIVLAATLASPLFGILALIFVGGWLFFDLTYQPEELEFDPEPEPEQEDWRSPMSNTPAGARCPAIDPAGKRCVRETGHPGDHAAQPGTQVRVYRGAQQADAVAAFQADARALAVQGWFPTSQSWAPGQWGCGSWLVALILCVVLIGILVFIYMLIVKPTGTLTVTYELRAVSEPVVAAPTPSAIDDLERLAALRDSGALTAEEFEAKKADLLGRI